MAVNVATILALCLNMTSAIGVVFLNKLVYIRHQFPSMSLTLTHFIVTAAGIQVFAWVGLFKPKRLPLLKVAPLSASFCGFVVFTNLSLQFNTVGTYQLAKAMTTPVIMLIQATFYGKRASFAIALTVIPVLLGVILNSYYDVRFNTLGTLFAVIGVIITSVYQIWVGTMQTDMNVNSMQLLHYQAFLSSIMLACVVPFFEPILSQASSLSVEGLLMVLSSGIVALMVNLSIFLVIGKTSAITYNMAGHFKFCVTLLGGYFLFGDPVSTNQLLGVSCTISGIGIYTYLKLSEQAREEKRILQSRRPIISP